MDKRSFVISMSVLLTLITIFSVTASASYGQKKKKKKKVNLDETTFPIKPQPAECKQFKKIGDCPDVGCGAKPAEELLNQRKNIPTADLASATNRQFDSLRKKTMPAGFTYGGSRDVLTESGEGDVVRIVAWLTNIRVGSQETCNCKLWLAKDTDNHMVLINDYVINHYKPADWEKHSFTAEFAPRVKKDHPKFKRSVILPLIRTDPRKRLKVRLTGTLLFDDYHQFHNPLKRETNWEVHPVFRFEYCPAPNKCTLNSDDGWVDIDG